MENEIKKFWLKEHFTYEVNMLRASLNFKEIIFENKEGLINLKNNLCIECFLLHFRNLLEFFYHKNFNRKNMAHVQHYLKKEVNWADIRPLSRNYIRRLNNKINKYLSHVNYERNSEFSEDLKDRKWDLNDMNNKLNSTIKIFLDNLDDSYLFYVDNSLFF